MIGDANGESRGFLIREEVAREILRATGERVFDERCVPCHGETGRGDGLLADVLPIRPRNYREEPFEWGTRPSQIVETVRSGRSGVMPAFEGELTPSEIWAVAYRVWSWIPAERRDQDDPEDLVDVAMPTAERAR